MAAAAILAGAIVILIAANLCWRIIPAFAAIVSLGLGF